MIDDALVRILNDRDSVPKGRLPDIGEEDLVRMLVEMVRIRVFDRRMLALQRQGRIGFYGPVTGQEGAIVGSASAAAEEDWIVPALREGGIAIMRGLPLVEAVAQLIGNALDRCKGRQMPCHYTWKPGRYVSMSSVIGTQISHATGLAMAVRHRGGSEAVLGFLGDGATSSNDFHAGLNFAAVRKAPVVFVCQNNQWSISVPFSKQTASGSVAAKAVAYGMPGVRVDGNDVLAVRAVMAEALSRARAGEGPTLVECLTYRRLGHSSSDDPSRYRDESEVERWEAKDPIARFRRFLENRGLWDDSRQEETEDRIAGEINRAIREAEAAGPVPEETLIQDVFETPDPRLVEHFRNTREGRT